jgi:inhibitor of growth protein 3
MPKPTSGRDNLTTNAHGLPGANVPPAYMQHLINSRYPNNQQMSRTEQMDAAAVLDDFTNRVANLPEELKHFQDEIYEQDVLRQTKVREIANIDHSIQKWIRQNGSHAPYPKEEEYRAAIAKLYDEVQKCDDEKIALDKKILALVDRHTLYLDKQIEALIQKGDMTEDATIPSLLRDQSADRPLLDRPITNTAVMPTNPMGNSSLIAHGGLGRLVTSGAPQRAPSQQMSQQMNGGMPSSSPASPAAALLMQQKTRESSTGAANKRGPRLGTLPVPPSNLGRHSSAGPGTPKASTPTGRAGSAGPRAVQKIGTASSRKVAPHKQSTATKKKKSSLNRVKASRNKNSPTSTNDSELSDAESVSLDEDEDGSPRPATKGDGDEEMADADDDDGADDRKYCVCSSVSYGDMVACDNENCPLEWFHWSCVDLKSEPAGTWICPVCINAGFKK